MFHGAVAELRNTRSMRVAGGLGTIRAWSATARRLSRAPFATDGLARIERALQAL